MELVAAMFALMAGVPAGRYTSSRPIDQALRAHQHRNQEGEERLTLVLDSAALIALERGERPMWVRLKAAQIAAEVPVTHGGVVGQVWRGGSRQARLARALAGIDVRPLDETAGRAAGSLLAAAGLSDVIDAALALLAQDGDEIVTGDRDDFGPLVSASGRHIELIRP